MAHHSARSGAKVYGPVEYGNALVHRARNEALTHVRPEADFILFVDDDMIPDPDALDKLLAHDVPVVSALCTTRIPPVTYAFRAYDEATEQFAGIDTVRPGAFFSGKFGAGFAFLLMRREVVQRLAEYYLSANDWLDENRRMLDRLAVRSEKREAERARKEAIRRARYESEQILRVFNYQETDDELQLGEDIALSKKLIRLGIPIAIDAAVKVGHLGEHAYGPWDIDDNHAD